MASTLLHGDCREVMRELPENSVDAICTDPPAGIAFMSKEWDRDKGGRDQWIAWLTDVLAECLRVAKPGAHAFVWALPRTSGWTHRALEDAGWDVRDCVTHLTGQGFPKSHNLPGGYGTALKPAAEFWYLARKPFKSTVARNVTEHGTGALNIDGCRIGTDARPFLTSDRSNGNVVYGDGLQGSRAVGETSLGRWPANVILGHAPECREVGVKRVKGTNKPGPAGFPNKSATLSFNGNPQPNSYADPDGYETVTAWECAPDCAVALLDAQSGPNMHSAGHARSAIRTEVKSGMFGMGGNSQRHGDAGGASRFFLDVAPDAAHNLTCNCEICTISICTSEDPNQPDQTDTTSPQKATFEATSMVDSASSIPLSGSGQTALFLTDTKSITSTGTSRTPTSPISNYSRGEITSDCTPAANGETASGGNPVASAENTNRSTLNTGTSAERDTHSTGAVVPAISDESLPINSDGATRCLYQAKASRAERNAGLGGPDGVHANMHPT